ncbi:VOC family protein [Lederbergia graminis]|uniref:VOC family protein n=1 Tax=Lederbergia graminis TaxID=735518 RepID=A0ABW0LJU1_9BACI
MTLQSSMTFINLPVKDLQKTMDFFTHIGFAFNPQFTDENAASMIINDNTYAHFLIESYFKTFITKEISDAKKSTEVLIALAAESKEQVDEIVNKAIASGGSPASDPKDLGFMYQWSFQDLDGHIWEVAYMDPSAMQEG